MEIAHIQHVFGGAKEVSKYFSNSTVTNGLSSSQLFFTNEVMIWEGRHENQGKKTSQTKKSRYFPKLSLRDFLAAVAQY